jgi:hypothetical protein
MEKVVAQVRYLLHRQLSGIKTLALTPGLEVDQRLAWLVACRYQTMQMLLLYREVQGRRITCPLTHRKSHKNPVTDKLSSLMYNF